MSTVFYCDFCYSTSPDYHTISCTLNKEENMTEPGNNLEDYKFETEETYDDYLRFNHPAFNKTTFIDLTKAEDGKVKPSLARLPARVLLSVANVLTFGGIKYYPNKWLKEPTSSFARVDSALRHINSWLQGIDTDNESKLHHLDHAICQLMMAKEYINLNITDGRAGKDND